MLVADDLELDAVEVEFVAALAAALPVRVLRRALPPSLRPASFRGRLAARGVAEVDWSETPLAPLAPPPRRRRSLACARGSSREPRERARDGRRRGRARHRTRRGGRGAGDRPTAAARGGPRRALRGHGRRPPAARDLRAALHGPSLPPRHSAPPAPLAAAALRPRGALAAAALPLPRAGAAGGDGVPDLRARAVRRAPRTRRAASPRALGPDEPRGRHRLRPQPLDPRPARVGRGRARGRGGGEGPRAPRATAAPRGRRGGAAARRRARSAGRSTASPARRPGRSGSRGCAPSSTSGSAPSATARRCSR